MDEYLEGKKLKPKGAKRGLAKKVTKRRSEKHFLHASEVKAEPQAIVAMRNGFGSTHIVDMLVGDRCPGSDKYPHLEPWKYH
jgi:hypothetical protein